LTTPRQTTLVIIGGSPSFHYLMRRYTERIGYSIEFISASVSMESVCGLRPFAVIFSSVETLENSQLLVAEMTNRDIPILVCSSTADQLRTRELGADYCLLHPLIYDNFSAILATAAAWPGSDRLGDVE
jgi:hypothetical protein